MCLSFQKTALQAVHFSVRLDYRLLFASLDVHYFTVHLVLQFHDLGSRFRNRTFPYS